MTTSGLFENKMAFITGGAQGIGLAVASAFVAQGAVNPGDKMAMETVG